MTGTMSKSRLEAFSDGVIAIIITIMVLELRPPEDADLAGLWGLHSQFLAYILSFVFVGIYWSNHHHLLHATAHITGGVLWANLHLLFWLSMVPFVTAWMGEKPFQPVPTAAYGVVLLMDAIAYTILQNRLIATHGRDSKLARAVGRGAKEWLSLAGYVTAVPLAFAWPVASYCLYFLIALVWLVPDRRIERQLTATDHSVRQSVN
jgi:TMEM175 potassium channel family protein